MTRELAFRVTIKDCEVETFNVSGGGGQRRDKKDTGVRIRHRPSGAVGVGRESRRQIDNKRAAFRRMGESEEFQRWVRIKAAALAPVARQLLEPDVPATDIMVEVRRAGVWEPE